MATSAKMQGALTAAMKDVKREGGLTDQQFDMLYYYMLGNSKSKSGQMAGYSSEHATSVAWHSPRVQAAMALVLERFLTTELAPLAMREAYRILDNPNTAAGVKANLATSIMDRAGFDAKRHDRQAAQEKDPSRKSPEELRAEIEALEAALLAKARDVTPVGAPSDPYAIDFE